METVDLDLVVRRQEGAVSRRQLVAAGYSPGHLAEKVARGAWQRVHPGVAVVHTGPLPWRTRAFAALLYAQPGSALSHRSAAFVRGFTRSAPQPIEVVVPWQRRVTPRPGLLVRRRRRLPDVDGALPAVVAREAVLDVWETVSSVDSRVALLASALRQGVPASEISRAADERSRLTARALLADLLAESAAGVESPMEGRYHRDVSRRHGLPPCTLQKRDRVGGRRIRSDGWYEEYGVRVELDGELAHPGGRTARDTWRDNAVLIERGDLTLRYRWEHVAGDPCGTAAQVAAALRTRGWTGSPHPCGPGCTIERAR